MSAEQRTQYKAVYSQSYTKYLHLHKVLQQINQRSAVLEEKLKRTARNSSQFKVHTHTDTHLTTISEKPQ